MTSPIFLNSGGGIFGALRRKVAEDRNLLDAFGDRVRPGRLGRDARGPHVILTHSGGTLDHTLTWVPPNESAGDFWDVWRETIQISVYADNYETCRQLGRLLHTRISRQTFCADLVATTLFPDSRSLSIDSNRGDQGIDVWHFDFRYHHWLADRLAIGKFVETPSS